MLFSLPLYPGLSPEQIEKDVYPFLEECKDYISDLYVTNRLAPFTDDAMGGKFVENDADVAFENAMVISEKFDIDLSLTYNNIHLPATYENYRVFANGFKTLYERGVSAVTIPHTSWLRFGLKKEFPDLIIKNTILHSVNTAAEVVKLYNEGFDYITLDRNLLRDHDRLKEIGYARDFVTRNGARPLHLSILSNEHCEGFCPVQKDHYNYNCHRNSDLLDPYFKSPMGDISPCKVKDENSVLWSLKSASLPHLRDEIEIINSYVDILKLHGRESIYRFYESMELVRQYARGEDISDPITRALKNADQKIANRWLRRIRTCKFDCWKCKACEQLASVLKTTKENKWKNILMVS